MFPCRKLFAVTLAVAAATGCASTGNPRRGEPTCSAQVGMSETQFLECACFRPYVKPEGGVALVTSVDSNLGTLKAYRCSVAGALGTTRGDDHVISVSTTNGRITRVGR